MQRVRMTGFKKELEDNILRFWQENMPDRKYGGFYGAIDGQNRLNRRANKGIVMNARILWTFSAAYRVLQQESYLSTAQRAFSYITSYFLDREYGGVFWELDYKGNPLNRKKQTYAQSFALYAFSEYYRACGEREALDIAISLFHAVERSKDSRLGGYLEAFTVDWQPIEDMRLSEKDENEVKTMNTHLHVLESYTNLLRIWPEKKLQHAQRCLIDVFLQHIYCADTGHLQLFFDVNWNVKGNIVSYGHDIEAAWLLWEAVSVLNYPALKEEIKAILCHIAGAATEGLLPDGSMAYEQKNGVLDKERHWWVQAEAVVGYQYMAEICKNENYKRKAEDVWRYIQDYIVDREYGEWYWSRLPDGSINKEDDKAGFWKCPYHNSRMCLEMIENFNRIT